MEKYQGQHIVRQNVLARATEILTSKGIIKPDSNIDSMELFRILRVMTDELEKIIINESGSNTK